MFQYFDCQIVAMFEVTFFGIVAPLFDYYFIPKQAIDLFNSLIYLVIDLFLFAANV